MSRRRAFVAVRLLPAIAKSGTPGGTNPSALPRPTITTGMPCIAARCKARSTAGAARPYGAAPSTTKPVAPPRARFTEMMASISAVSASCGGV